MEPYTGWRSKSRPAQGMHKIPKLSKAAVITVARARAPHGFASASLSTTRIVSGIDSNPRLLGREGPQALLTSLRSLACSAFVYRFVPRFNCPRSMSPLFRPLPRGRSCKLHHSVKCMSATMSTDRPWLVRANSFGRMRLPLRAWIGQTGRKRRQSMPKPSLQLVS